MNRIKKDDQVIVITGKDKGRQGKVLKILRTKNRIIVEGTNMLKKHIKPNPQRGQQGGIIEKEGSMHVSNVALLNPITGKADKIGFKFLEDGRKVRYFKSNNELVDI